MQNLKIPVLIDPISYSSKPDNTEVGKIKNRLNQEFMSVNEIKELLLAGQSIIPVHGGIRLSEWIGQQLIFLDFDDANLEDKLEFLIDNGLYPACIYTTFSDTDNTRFRIVLVMDRMIRDPRQMTAIMKYLVNVTDADPACADLVHLYFGGKETLYYEPDAKICIDDLNLALGYSPTISAHKPRVASNTCSIQDNIQHIRVLDSQWFVKKMPRMEEVIAKSTRELIQYQKCISLSQILGVEIDEMFNCVLPDHEDDVPSAKIYQADNGLEFYKCFGCDTALLPNHFIELIASCDQEQARCFISEIFNIRLVESEARKSMNKVLDANIERILSGEIFEIAPAVYQYTKHDIIALLTLTNMAKFYTAEENIITGDRAVFYSSINELAANSKRTAKESGEQLTYSGYSHAAISKKVQNLNQIGLIQKLSIDELPSQIKNDILDHKNKTRHSRYTNCYSIPAYNVTYLTSLERQARSLKENGYTKSGCGKEYSIRTFGKEAANDLYPQEASNLSIRSETLTLLIEVTIKEVIAQKGYCLDQDIYHSLRERFSMRIVDTQLKKCRTQLLNRNGWLRTRDNEIRRKFNLPVSRGCPPFITTNLQ